MSLRTKLYILVVTVMGIFLTWWAVAASVATGAHWTAFAVLLALAIVTELFRSDGVSMSHSALPVVEFAALLLLPPSLFVLLVALSLLFTWGRARWKDRRGFHEWFKLPFNISMTIISAFAGIWWVSTFFSARLDAANTTTSMALMIASAAIIMVLVNHLILGTVLTLVKNQPLGFIFKRDPNVVLADFALLLLGYILALLWTSNPAFILLVLSPFYLIYRALWIPRLEQVAQTDGKTGLLRAQHFMTLAAAEFARVRRANQPMSVLMADLDLLRDVNNRYGHLAGDAVLKGVGTVIRDTIRQGDVAGRFGGEEFAIILPNTPSEEARATAARIRRAVEGAAFTVDTSQTPIKVTMSVGVASFPQEASTLAQLLHEADVAVYYAKEMGRNRVIYSQEVPAAFRQSRTGLQPQDRAS